jgi:DNA-binding response OmpR family regulator
MTEQPAILLIEDEANLRHNLGVLLEGDGYRVVTAEDGAVGIRKLREEPFDLVITDVVMPEVDGFQVMEYLKDYAPDVVVIAMTAYVSTESAIEALRHGAYDYLAKPFDVDLMQIVIKRALEKARMQKAFHHYMGELERQVEERTRHLAEAKGNLEQSLEVLRATQEQLVQTERFRALGEMTGSVAQDLGDSLAMIVGFAHVLAKIAPAESRIVGHLEQIGEVAFGCHEIVKNLANFPWKHPLRKVQTCLNTICEDMLTGLAYQADLRHIVVARQLDESLPPIMVDPHQLLQAFSSIALHACRTLSSYRGGGRLTVETKWGDDVIQVTFHVDRLEVAKGCHGEPLGPFLTIRESADRLDLSLAYGVIKEHGGKMAVHCIPEEGATYAVELPLHGPSPSGMELLLGELRGAKRRRVLVVDADERNLALLQEIVQHLGHDADQGSSAQQALQKIAAHDYDLVITDMHLPGLDGLYLYQRLRELRPGLAQRMIFISGSPLSDEVGALLERTGCSLISKPFSVADIEIGMRQVLGGCEDHRRSRSSTHPDSEPIYLDWQGQ